MINHTSILKQILLFSRKSWQNLSVLAFIFSFSTTVYAQAVKAPLVILSGSGETTYAPASGFNYSHHSNYAMNIRSIKAKWEMRTLFGEPIVNGVFKWQAGEGTPVDYLDYRDYVLLECSPKKSIGYLVYIRLLPTVPKSGEGYGFNTPGSPLWKNLFCTRTGEPITSKVPDFNANTAKEIWKNGFYVTGIVLARLNGDDGYLQSIKETNNTKYKALLNPFTLTVKNYDTVTSDRIRLLKDVNPYFAKAAIIVTSTCKQQDVAYVAQSANEDISVGEGWNTLRYYLIQGSFRIRDSVKVFYKKSAKRILLRDDFDDGVMDDRITNAGYQSEYTGLNETNGYLLLKQGGEKTRVIPRTRELAVDPNKEVIIEFNSLLHPSGGCQKASVSLNSQYIVCRKSCNVPEAVKITWDIKNGLVKCFINGELNATAEGEQYKSLSRTIQFEFSCYQFMKWQIDNLVIWQE